MRKRFVLLLLASLICFSFVFSSTSVYADDKNKTTKSSGNGTADEEKKKGESKLTGCTGSWCKIGCNQKPLQTALNGDGWCVYTSFFTMLENSGTLKDEYQQSSPFYCGYSDSIDTSCKYFKGFDAFHAPMAGAWSLSSGVTNANNVCDKGTWSLVSSTTMGSYKTGAGSAGEYLVEINGTSLGKCEVNTTIKDLVAYLYNNGYWVIIGVNNPNNWGDYNGPSGHTARHQMWVCGVDDKEIYVNDSGNTSDNNDGIFTLADYYSGGTVVCWLCPVKCDKVTWKSASHGGAVLPSDANSDSSTVKDGEHTYTKGEDGKWYDENGNEVDEATVNAAKANNNSLGVSGAQFMGEGYYSEQQLFSGMTLMEADISEMLNVSIEDFGQTDREALESWKTNVEAERDKNSANAWIRRIVMIFGILLTIWSFVVYVAYWFDRLNNLLAFSLLELLTFQRLSLSDTEETCTFSLRNLGQRKRTVNHRAILLITVIGIVFGALLISGAIYKVIYIIVHKVLDIMYG